MIARCRQCGVATPPDATHCAFCGGTEFVQAQLSPALAHGLIVAALAASAAGFVVTACGADGTNLYGVVCTDNCMSFEPDSGASTDSGSADAASPEGLVCRDGAFYYRGAVFSSCTQCVQPGSCSFTWDAFDNPTSASCAGETATCPVAPPAGDAGGSDAGAIATVGAFCSAPLSYRCAGPSTHQVLGCGVGSGRWEPAGTCPAGQRCDPHATSTDDAGPFRGLCQPYDAGTPDADHLLVPQLQLPAPQVPGRAAQLASGCGH